MRSFFKDLLLFPVWWYLLFPRFLFSFLRKLLVFLDQRLAATLMLKMLFVPLFGDVSPIGRLISLIFRLLRGVLGLAVIVLTAFSFLVIFCLWLFLPPFLFFRFFLKAPLVFLVLALMRALVKALLRLRQRYQAKSEEKEMLLRLATGEEGEEKSDEESRREVFSWLKQRREWHRPPFLWEERYRLGPMGGVNRAWTGRVTPTLDRYSVDLTLEAQRGKLPPLIGKKEPLEKVVRALEKSTVNNALLVGPVGAGKTSLVYGIAQEITRGAHSLALLSKRLVSLEMGVLLAGAQTSGELSERLVDLMKDIEASGNIILFIDEIHNAVAAGGGVDTSLVFSSLEPRLTAGRFQMMGATSWENYRKYIEPNEAFARLFEMVELEEATFAETVEILKILSFKLERDYQVKLTYPALKAAVELSVQFIHERVLPDKAVGLLEEAVVSVSRKKEREWVKKEDVERLVSEKTHIPLTQVGAEESKKLLELEERMHQRLIGQEEAVKTIADAVRRARVGLREKTRPIVSLLFVGPTGVGKTETAKALAETFFGDEERMIRLDMSEYQREDSINRLLGSPAGAERAAEGGLLTEAVRKAPFSLVLFDEVEKAHARILDIFLQILEEGRLTDARGRRVDFRNAILIFTSNAGTDVLFQGLKEGKDLRDIEKDMFSFLQSSFRVELLNRFDGIILFSPLTMPQVEKIVRLKLKKVAGQMVEKEITLSFSDALVKSLAREGFDPALGARPLRRLIQDKIEAPLAKKLLRREWSKGTVVELKADFLEGR